MEIRENSITFWEKTADKPAYRCSNNNCLRQILLSDKEAESYVLEQRLAEWELNLDSIGGENTEEYELQELMQCLRKTMSYMQHNDAPHLSAKGYFLQELSRKNKRKPNAQQVLSTVIPLAALGLTLIALILLGPKVGELLKASLLSLPH